MVPDYMREHPQLTLGFVAIGMCLFICAARRVWKKFWLDTSPSPTMAVELYSDTLDWRKASLSQDVHTAGEWQRLSRINMIFLSMLLHEIRLRDGSLDLVDQALDKLSSPGWYPMEPTEREVYRRFLHTHGCEIFMYPPDEMATMLRNVA